MFGLNWFRIAMYVASCALIIGMIWTINSWRVDSNNLEAAQTALKAEQDCLVGSKCADRILKEAQEANEVVAKAKADAQKQNDEDRIKRDQAAQEAANKQATQMQKYQADLLKIMSHQSSPSCQEQRRQVITCPLD